MLLPLQNQQCVTGCALHQTEENRTEVQAGA